MLELDKCKEENKFPDWTYYLYIIMGNIYSPEKLKIKLLLVSVIEIFLDSKAK